MSLHVILLQIILFLSVPNAISSPQDTIPPTYTWIAPADFSILTTNNERLCIDAHDNENGSGIQKVIFYVEHYDHNCRKIPKYPIGEVTSFPYEILWDCSEVPDCSIECLFFYCDVIDKAGNTASKPEGSLYESYALVLLDRNPTINESKLISRRTKKDIIIDGNLSEWSQIDSIVFSNNDNKIITKSLWNRENLFLCIIVHDLSVISRYKPERETTDGINLDDIIEIFIDTNNDHNEIFAPPDKHFMISAAGKVVDSFFTYDIKNHQYYTNRINLDKDSAIIKTAVTLNGTLNNDHYNDSGYSIELMIPWKELKVDPEHGSILGFEIWNADKDFILGNYYYAGWCTIGSNLINPSEWSDIILVDSNLSKYTAYAILCAALFGVIFFLIIIKSKRSNRIENNTTATVIEKDSIIKAKHYIKENYSNELLSRDDVAKFVGLSPTYFSKQFNKETGQNITEYTVHVRLEKAKNLLISTKKNISEIAFEVGFGSQSYFSHLFKKTEQKSPSEFRKQFLKR